MHVCGKVGAQVNILRFESKSYKGFKVEARGQVLMHHLKKAPLERKLQKKVRMVSMGLSSTQKRETEEGTVTKKKSHHGQLRSCVKSSAFSVGKKDGL